MKKEDLFEGAYIEMRGNNDLLVEGCEGLLRYDENLISLQIGRQTLNISGRRMQMRYLSDKKIAISGYIKGVNYV
jgi:sporulation protein YqfC